MRAYARGAVGKVADMSERWYKEAVVYCVDVETFQDSDDDGWGDLRGLTGRLDYLARLGVTCLWLNPIHPTPNRDNGYDVADFYGVDARLGSLGDFAELALEARERGIRLLLDLVVNHTSDQHPWFRAACADARSPYRDWYVWSDDEPPDRRQGVVFPGEQTETWTWNDEAGAWYFHRFYDFQPDLNWRNPAVREEIKKVMGFWLQLGASGFRIDAAPFVLEQVAPGVDPAPKDFSILEGSGPRGPGRGAAQQGSDHLARGPIVRLERAEECCTASTLLARGGVAALAASLLLLRGRAALPAVAPVAGPLTAVLGRVGRVGDLRCSRLRHALLLERLVLLLVLDVGTLGRHARCVPALPARQTRD